NFINDYQITFWLFDQSAFNVEYLAKNDWLQQYQPATKNAELQLKQGTTPVLQPLMKTCSRFENEQFVLLSSECILSEIQSN
ncbi:MAG: hypothetical protein RI580_06135, partial [Halothece sp. Uz-M2-17]|nr:hypothetical protein [Halothece sp. Uz-M2-17]